MKFSFKLCGKPITLKMVEEVVAVRPTRAAKAAETTAKFLRRLNTAAAMDDSAVGATGGMLPARGRKLFEKAGWLFAEAEKKLPRAATSRSRTADTEGVRHVFVDSDGKTLIATGLVVVQRPAGLNEKQALARLKKEGLKVIRTLTFGTNLYECQLPSNRLLHEAIPEMQDSDQYVFAEPAILQVLAGRFTPTDPGFRSQWQYPEKVSGPFFLRLFGSSSWPERACQTKLAGRALDPGLASIGLTALNAMPQ
jgi:hypothetical protein